VDPEEPLHTCCVFRRKRAFTSASVVHAVWAQILPTAEAESFAVLAYCFMPDHLHLLAVGQQASSDLVRFMDRVKQISGYWYQQRTRARLWQPSYWDRVLRDEDDRWTAIRYIFENPVRAGLVPHPLAYSFSGSAVSSRAQLIEAFGDPDCPRG
jgi:putative transposase